MIHERKLNQVQNVVLQIILAHLMADQHQVQLIVLGTSSHAPTSLELGLTIKSVANRDLIDVVKKSTVLRNQFKPVQQSLSLKRKLLFHPAVQRNQLWKIQLKKVVVKDYN